MPDYSKLQDTAFRLIKQAGQVLTFSRSVPGAYDPIAGEDATATVTTQQVVGVVLPMTANDDNRIEGLTLSKQRKILVAAKDVPELLPEDRTTYEGKTWKLEGVSPLNPAGTALIYKGALRLV